MSPMFLILYQTPRPFFPVPKLKTQVLCTLSCALSLSEIISSVKKVTVPKTVSPYDVFKVVWCHWNKTVNNFYESMTKL